MPHHTRPGAHHTLYSQTSQSVPSLHKPEPRPKDPRRPYRHMTDTYAWVVEQEFVKLDKQGRNTEQWIREQQRRVPDGPARQEIGERVRRRMWEDMMYRYEVEAERWMRHEEEMRRAAAERERRRENLIREELRRMEERLRQQKEAAEQKARQESSRSRSSHKRHEEQRYQERPKSDKTLQDSWKRYEDQWKTLSSSSEPLTFSNVSWPVAFKPRTPEHITLSAIAEFLLSPVHSQNLTRKDRIRNAQLRWHPDRFQRMMQRVDEGEKAQVAEGVGIVARSLNELMSREKQRVSFPVCHKSGFVELTFDTVNVRPSFSMLAVTRLGTGDPMYK
ncbi:hypothetical protein PM082_001766 [Marasmius tenuissimus]|nr:hypothetical protein PM082_001766 [Marasmius tenuissimus]